MPNYNLSAPNVGFCPVCGQELEHSSDMHNDGKHEDTFACEFCSILVTYITPDDRREYHEYGDHEIIVEMEGMIPPPRARDGKVRP